MTIEEIQLEVDRRIGPGKVEMSVGMDGKVMICVIPNAKQRHYAHTGKRLSAFWIAPEWSAYVEGVRDGVIAMWEVL